ncbi:LEA type 2 family protein [Pseudomonas sp. F1_0610]|uniref:LEA type 2 family protein n=1 Tax=Pseudomonas sp. F1_0610 TaxID=3114284 RepID=UPI0039C04738
MARIRYSFTSITLLMTLMFLNGCSTWLSSNFQQPDIQLTSIELVQAKLVEQEFKLQFRVDNPNDSSLALKSMKYDVQINNIPLAQGSQKIWLTVPAKQHKHIELTVFTNLWRHMKSIIRLIEKPNTPIEYQLDTEFKTGGMFGKKVNVSRTGQFVPGNLLLE